MISLRRHQSEAADAVEAAFRRGVHRPLVDMCVGAGKSLTFGELARREVERGGRVIIGAHTRELVEQNAKAARALGLDVGINAAALNERVWRAPVISAAIQSVHRLAASFGPVTLLLIDEAHLLPHSEAGMYHTLVRGLGGTDRVRVAGGSGTVFRLQGGSLVEGEAAPFDEVVYTYSILDGIRDGYLVPAFSVGATEKMDPALLRTRQGEYTGESQDAQMLAAMDNHIAQMVHHGSERRAWLVFEATVKACYAMAARMNEWGIPTGIVLGETPAAERRATIEAFRTGHLRALVNRDALTTGFDVQQVDMLVMRRATKSLGLYIQMTGRLLRPVGGHIDASLAAGKADGIVLDFAGNIDRHGPLDFIRPKETKARLVSCDCCSKRVPAAALRCWSCGETMTKLCPMCLEPVAKGTLDCPHCQFDMRPEPSGQPKQSGYLSKVPSGAALIASWGKSAAREGGWLAVQKVHQARDFKDTDDPAWKVLHHETVALAGDREWIVPEKMAPHAKSARWLRGSDDGEVIGMLVPNGGSRSHIWQIRPDGSKLMVPMPSASPTS